MAKQDALTAQYANFDPSHQASVMMSNRKEFAAAQKAITDELNRVRGDPALARALGYEPAP